MRYIVPALLLLTVQAFADDYCNDVRQISEKVITLKYDGVPANELMGILENNALGVSIVIDAYKAPTFQVKKNQRKHIREFADERYIWCIEAMNEKR